MDIENIRRDYRADGLRRESLSSDPLMQFDAWMTEACESGIKDPTAMVLATVSSEGRPSQRIVLLKHFDKRGFVFYTNYESRKAQEIAENANVSLLFPWHSLDRQVQIHGKASKVKGVESLKYFSERPIESRLAAWASKQSARISSRQLLTQQFEAMKQKFRDGKIPLPDFWGGYRVEASDYEFWQGGSSRLHDRFIYTRENNDQPWDIGRLAP